LLSAENPDLSSFIYGGNAAYSGRHGNKASHVRFVVNDVEIRCLELKLLLFLLLLLLVFFFAVVALPSELFVDTIRSEVPLIAL